MTGRVCVGRLLAKAFSRGLLLTPHERENGAIRRVRETEVGVAG